MRGGLAIQAFSDDLSMLIKGTSEKNVEGSEKHVGGKDFGDLLSIERRYRRTCGVYEVGSGEKGRHSSGFDRGLLCIDHVKDMQVKTNTFFYGR